MTVDIALGNHYVLQRASDSRAALLYGEVEPRDTLLTEQRL